MESFVSKIGETICYIHWKPHNEIDLYRAIEICSMRKEYEAIGCTKFVNKVGDNVSIDKDAQKYFSEYNQLKDISHIAIVDEGLNLIFRGFLNFINAIKEKPVVRYFKDIEEAEDWIVEQ